MDLSLTSELLYQAGTLTDMQSWLTAQTLWGDHKGNEIPSHEKQDSPCSSSHPAYGQPRETKPRAPCSYREAEWGRGIGAERHGTVWMPRLLHLMPLDHKAMSWFPHFLPTCLISFHLTDAEFKLISYYSSSAEVQDLQAVESKRSSQKTSTVQTEGQLQG